MIGYRVRGTTRDGQAIPLSDTPLGDLAAVQRAVGFHEARGSTVRIFAVAEDGAETRLPTYEEALGERDALLTLLDRIDCDGKSLPGDVHEDISKALDAARKAGWRRS